MKDPWRCFALLIVSLIPLSRHCIRSCNVNSIEVIGDYMGVIPIQNDHILLTLSSNVRFWGTLSSFTTNVFSKCINSESWNGVDKRNISDYVETVSYSGFPVGHPYLCYQLLKNVAPLFNQSDLAPGNLASCCVGAITVSYQGFDDFKEPWYFHYRFFTSAIGYSVVIKNLPASAYTHQAYITLVCVILLGLLLGVLVAVPCCWCERWCSRYVKSIVSGREMMNLYDAAWYVTWTRLIWSITLFLDAVGADLIYNFGELVTTLIGIVILKQGYFYVEGLFQDDSFCIGGIRIDLEGRTHAKLLLRDHFVVRSKKFLRLQLIFLGYCLFWFYWTASSISSYVQNPQGSELAIGDLHEDYVWSTALFMMLNLTFLNLGIFSCITMMLGWAFKKKKMVNLFVKKFVEMETKEDEIHSGEFDPSLPESQTSIKDWTQLEWDGWINEFKGHSNVVARAYHMKSYPSYFQMYFDLSEHGARDVAIEGARALSMPNLTLANDFGKELKVSSSISHEDDSSASGEELDIEVKDENTEKK